MNQKQEVNDMPKRIHFLNVEDGDCSIIERPDSGRHTIIDICCGNIDNEVDKSYEDISSSFSEEARPRGNYNFKSSPTNPIQYLKDIGIVNIHRFILTHPDMDHMDGIKQLFSKITITNFWDTGVKREAPSFENGKYLKADWDFFQKLRANEVEGVTTLSPKAGDKGKYWAYDDDQNNGNGDYLSIIAPTTKLVEEGHNANFNDASYVIVYRSPAGNIIFPGDSEDHTWEYILKNHCSLVKNAAVLFAPHHGRDSDRDWKFLDIVNPKLSFLGNAKSKHLGYSAWKNRGLEYFTNNQCGNIRIDFEEKRLIVSIENKEYAQKFTKDNTYNIDGYWYLLRK